MSNSRTTVNVCLEIKWKDLCMLYAIITTSTCRKEIVIREYGFGTGVNLMR
jgi:hypothetical protein